MKKLLAGILLGAAGLYGYQNLGHPRATAEAAAGQESAETESESATATSSSAQTAFHCDGRQYCSQMKSYEEAVYFTSHCPGTKMDGDHDGIPCERQFNR